MLPVKVSRQNNADIVEISRAEESGSRDEEEKCNHHLQRVKSACFERTAERAAGELLLKHAVEHDEDSKVDSPNHKIPTRAMPQAEQQHG